MECCPRAKNYTAEAAVNPYRFMKYGTAASTAIQAAAATDSIIGISDSLGAVAANDRVDVLKCGQAMLELGGAVTRGDLGTSDADGKGVTAAPAGGSNNRIGCIFEESGVSGDIVPVTITLCSVQG